VHATHGHLGLTEIATLLGVSRQRVHQLRSTYADFPEPVADLASGPIWHERDISTWHATHAVRPGGRPRSKPQPTK
jgi:predicted DNA-binding transcriptional regulator AlpA